MHKKHHIESRWRFISVYCLLKSLYFLIILLFKQNGHDKTIILSMFATNNIKGCLKIKKVIVPTLIKILGCPFYWIVGKIMMHFFRFRFWKTKSYSFLRYYCHLTVYSFNLILKKLIHCFVLQILKVENGKPNFAFSSYFAVLLP